MGIAKRHLDVIVANDFLPGRRAQRSIIVQSLIHDVPSGDAALVSSDDFTDVVAHSFQQNIAGNGSAFFVLEHPLRHLRMPHQIVADDEHVVLLAKFHILVSQRKIVGAGVRMNDLPLQHILGTNGVELGFDERVFEWVLSRKLRRIQRCSDQKTTFVGVFQSRLLLRICICLKTECKHDNRENSCAHGVSSIVPLPRPAISCAARRAHWLSTGFSRESGDRRTGKLRRPRKTVRRKYSP